jgi:hypothetical protein
MDVKQTLSSILAAADPDDCEDAAIRKSLCIALKDVLAMRPPVEEPTADDSIGLPGFLTLRSDRRFSRARQDCLLSQVSGLRQKDWCTRPPILAFLAQNG